MFAALAAGCALLLATGFGSPRGQGLRTRAEAEPSASAYAPGWSAVHADGANSDWSPVRTAAHVDASWEIDIEGSVRIGPLPWTINLGATVDPAGRLYVTSTERGCTLRALDGRTGALRWCDAHLDELAVASSPLLDRNGRLFVADGTGMHAISRDDGARLWDVPLDGVPLSAQFTPDGNLVFVTHVGTLYVLDRSDGSSVLDPMPLAPGVTWNPSEGIQACARGTAACPSANTIAIDERGRIFFTLWAPGDAAAGLRAMRYVGGKHPRVEPLWTDESLPGGSASSPVLSRDSSRVYLTDNVDSMHALDARTGDHVWSFRIGYAAGGSISRSASDLLMPAGGRDSPVMAVRDTGDEPELAWRRDDLQNRGIATQTASDRAYVTIDTGGGTNGLVVLDTKNGKELDREPLAGTSVFSVGTTVGPRGTIYVCTIVGGVHAFDRTRTPRAGSTLR